MLPVMVCMDGWVLTHSYERVELLDQETVDQFLPRFQPQNYLDPADPKTWGSYAEADVLMEFKYAIHQAMDGGQTADQGDSGRGGDHDRPRPRRIDRSLPDR